MPTGSDYAAAIQNPRSAFSESYLQSAEAVRTSIGLPRPMSGNFAVVFHMRSATESWAVRCFHRDVPDLQRRYQAINDHLEFRITSDSSLVGFRYIPKGILVRGTWHPIVKMPWVNGTPLDQAVTEAIHQPERLRRLGDLWLRLDNELTELGVAHGDLQHGNVLVAGDSLRLVDYDGMYVPALAGSPSNEQGHANYQHPHRTDADFSPELDRFSSLVIYVALTALQRSPDLWRKYRMPDDALLFRRDDLQNPGSSALFSDLQASSDPIVARLATILRTASESGKSVPSLSQLMNDEALRLTSVLSAPGSWISAAMTVPESISTSESGRWWWKRNGSSSTIAERAGPFQPPERQSLLDRLKWWQRSKPSDSISQSIPAPVSGVVPNPVGRPNLPVTNQSPLGTSGTTTAYGRVVAPATTSIQPSRSRSLHPAPVTTQSAQPHSGRTSLPGWMKQSPKRAATPSVTTKPFVGSRSSYKFHLSSCGYARRIPAGNERWFDSVREAANAGYEGCRVCKAGQSRNSFNPATGSPSRTMPLRTASVPHATPASARSSPGRILTAEVGRTIELEYTNGDRITFMLVDSLTWVPGKDQVSTGAPLGKAVLGAKVGSIITYNAPGRVIRGVVRKIS